MANAPTFEERAPGWSAEGAEPPAEFKAEGYKPGYKPPADFFNWFWTKVSRNIAELQGVVTGYGAANEADKAAAAQKLAYSNTVYSETGGSATARMVAITGVVSWNDLKNIPVRIRAAAAGPAAATTLQVNQLPAQSLYFADPASDGLVLTPTNRWVRAGGVYTVVWDGQKLVCVTTDYSADTVPDLAATATKLATARTISLTGDATGSASFNGTANAAIAATVDTASQLRTARTLSLTGDVTGSASFNGTANAAIAATVGTASQLRTARTIRTNLADTAAASFNGTANIAPGVIGTLPIANGGTGRTDGRAAGINGILPTSITTLWSGSAALWDYISVNLDSYRWFFINGNGAWMLGHKSGTIIKAWGSYIQGNNLRTAAVTLTYSSATQWRYTGGSVVAHYFSASNSSDLGAPAITSISGMCVSGGVV